MINVQSKVHALHVQWVRRFLCSPSSWVSFLNFWFRSCFSASPSTVFSSPSRFIPSSLPPFYAALLDAWYACHGSFYPHAALLFSLFLPYLPKLTCTFFLSSPLPLIVWRSFCLRLVPCIGKPLGANSGFFPWIVQLLTFLGRWRMVCYIEPSD